ncbi:uncharacterized protein DNG_05807 [Cephalotrichum gorgonifer]|uniref:Uncharacterized protein n=1 Tax=Cephalotrichum gorgonifer TaxID=2041049 RepID=A0AAE8MYW1_9PEZI|nr:uncharacterized protein DNG_05807 [Cephalotrichum gorgonifer]
MTNTSISSPSEAIRTPSTSPSPEPSNNADETTDTQSELPIFTGSDNGLVQSDDPIPSIEEDPSSPSAQGYTMSGALHHRTPSFSLSPSLSAPSERLAILPNSRDGASRGSVSNIDQSLNQLRLSGRSPSLGMSDVATALGNVPLGSETRATLSPSPTPSATGGSSSRRRSGNRVKVPPHEVEDEEPPPDRFHEPGFQRAFNGAKRAVGDLRDVLGSGTLHTEPDSTMRRLHGEAVGLSMFQAPSTRTVGFVGDSGVGKSSLLNSLLDHKKLARASNNGGACTCVVTQYIYHDMDHFEIDVELFTMDEIMAQLTDLLQSYRHFHLHRNEMNEEEKQDFKKRADVALHTFQAMFRGRLGNERFLVRQEEDTVLDKLISWARELAPSSSSGRQVASSLSQCSTIIENVTTENSSSDGPAMWPYIRKIRVYLKAYVLKHGLVLVDLPGLRDLNTARRDITERYLLQCDEIFAVCNIGRAITDAGVLSVFELARQARLSNVGIICTKSDEIRAEEAVRDWEGETARKIQSMIDRVEVDRRDLERIRDELDDYGDDEDLLEEEEQHQLNLSRRARVTEKRMKEHEFQLTKYLITKRNAKVRQSIEAEYGPRMPRNGVKVFCVSNREYWNHRYAPGDEAHPHLLLSGIFAIRKHCLSIVTESQLRIAMKYLHDDVPALLGEIDLWVQSGAGTMDAERRRAVRRTLDTLENRLRRHLTAPGSRMNSIAKEMKDEFKDSISAAYRQNKTEWKRGATDASSIWHTWHPMTYMAFCRQYGTHYTRLAGSRNWNEEAINTMTADLDPLWENLVSELEDLQETTANLIEECLDAAPEYLDSELGDDSPSTAVLKRVLLSRQNLLLADVEDIWYKFETALSTLRTDALSGIRTSMIGRAMEPSYDQANFDRGDGSDDRRKDVINRRLADPQLFRDLNTEFKQRFGTLATELQTDIQTTIEKHLSIIVGTLNIVRDENVALESESDQAFRRRVEVPLLKSST